MKTLLYFEEFESILSHKLFERDDISVVILRSNNNMKFFTKEYLEKTKKFPTYVIDYFKPISNEVNKFKNWLSNNQIKLDYFLNDSEYYLEFSNQIATELGLEALSSTQTLQVRDKVIMKDTLKKSNIEVMKYKEIKNNSDFISFWESINYNPIIIKPRKEMNSKGVYKVLSKDDLKKIPYDITSGQYMVEEFCNGHEWSIEGLVQNGKVLDAYLSYLPNSTIWASINNDLHAHISYKGYPSYFESSPKEYLQKIIDAFKLKNGAITIEIFVMPNGKIIASELGWRLPGGMACQNHSMTHGFDIWNSLIDIAIKKNVVLNYKNKDICVGNLSLPNLEGIIEYVTPLEKLLSYDGVINGELYVNVGEYQKKRRVGSDSSGRIQICGKNPLDVLNKMKVIHNSFEIKVVDDKVSRKLCYEKK